MRKTERRRNTKVLSFGDEAEEEEAEATREKKSLIRPDSACFPSLTVREGRPKLITFDACSGSVCARIDTVLRVASPAARAIRLGQPQ
jgi:hypothetical protein